MNDGGKKPTQKVTYLFFFSVWDSSDPSGRVCLPIAAYERQSQCNNIKSHHPGLRAWTCVELANAMPQIIRTGPLSLGPSMAHYYNLQRILGRGKV